jgi:hypothetical protein
MPKPTLGDTPTRRHSGLDPESRIVLLGATRRKIMTNKPDSGLSQQ